MSTTQPDGYLALPASGKGSPILVLHAWWGLNNTIKALCERLADSGFAAFAPDLYHGEVTDQISEAERLGSALDEKADQARAELVEAVSFVKQRAGAEESGVAVIGFSLGVAYALDLAANAPDDVHSVVLFYGVAPAEFSQSKAAYQGHFAAEDPYEPPDNVQWLENALKEAGRPVTFYTYPGTGHWFFEPDRKDAYNEAAASLAWDRSLAFLRNSTSA